MTMTMAMTMTMTMGTPSPHRSNSPKAKPCKMHHCMAFNAENSKTHIVNASCFSRQIVLYSTYSPYAFYILSAYFPGSTITILIEPFPICSHSYFTWWLGFHVFPGCPALHGACAACPIFPALSFSLQSSSASKLPPWQSSFVGHFKGLYIWPTDWFPIYIYNHIHIYTHMITYVYECNQLETPTSRPKHEGKNKTWNTNRLWWILCNHSKSTIYTSHITSHIPKNPDEPNQPVQKPRPRHDSLAPWVCHWDPLGGLQENMGLCGFEHYPGLPPNNINQGSGVLFVRCKN